MTSSEKPSLLATATYGIVAALVTVFTVAAAVSRLGRTAAVMSVPMQARGIATFAGAGRSEPERQAAVSAAPRHAGSEQARERIVT